MPILGASDNIVRPECLNATIVLDLDADNKRADWKPCTKYCDILGLYFYPNYSRTDLINASGLGTTALQVKEETGLPILVIETSYPTGPRILEFDEEKQSQHVRAGCEEASTCDAITSLGWLRFSDCYRKSFPPQENRFALHTREGRPRSEWNDHMTQVRQRR